MAAGTRREWLPERLRDWLDAEGLTQQAAARMLGVSEGSLSGWLRGLRPKPPNLKLIADCAKLPVGFFLGRRVRTLRTAHPKKSTSRAKATPIRGAEGGEPTGGAGSASQARVGDSGGKS